MKCKHERTMSLYLKHNDTAGMSVEHLDVTIDGYLPYVGIFGGDDTDFEVCMDCGQIIGWKPIADEDVMNNESVREKYEERLEEEAREHERQAQRLRDAKSDRTPHVITIGHLVKGSQDNCPICGQPWALHDYRTSTPTCP